MTTVHLCLRPCNAHLVAWDVFSVAPLAPPFLPPFASIRTTPQMVNTITTIAGFSIPPKNVGTGSTKGINYALAMGHYGGWVCSSMAPQLVLPAARRGGAVVHYLPP